MFDKLFKKIKNFYDAYKIWVFVAALFSTNGLQAYLGNTESVKPPVEPVKEVVVKEVKELRQPVKLEVTCKSDTSVYDHVREHHGGR